MTRIDHGRFRIERADLEPRAVEGGWRTGALVAEEPSPDDVRAHAPELAAAYNEPHNRAMMGHGEMSALDVVTLYAEMRARSDRAFLFYRDGALVGDGDLRGIAGGDAELAIMIGPREAQGRGLGTHFAAMLHAFAFRTLGLSRLFIGVVPANVASRRLFEKLGYAMDDGPAARARADADEDVVMSVERRSFEAANAAALDPVRIVRL